MSDPSLPGPDLVEVYRLAQGGVNDLLGVPFALQEGDPASEVLERLVDRVDRLRALVALGPVLVLPVSAQPVVEPWHRPRMDPDAWRESHSWPVCRFCGLPVSPAECNPGVRVRETAKGTHIWAADAPPDLVIRNLGRLCEIHPCCARAVPRRFRLGWMEPTT
jgi:hypothetical protein